MKSINQIFKNNKSLMYEPEVVELIEYCQELEGEIIENKQSEKFSFEDKLTYWRAMGKKTFCDLISLNLSAKQF